MKILKKILIVLLAIIVLAAIIGFFMPSQFKMERSVSVKAEPALVFEQVNTLKNWENWSPWKKHDASIKNTYNDIPSGVGAISEWTSESSGEGKMTITESIPNELMKADLDFKDQGNGKNGFRLEKENDGTKLSWWFETEIGNNPFMRLMFKMMSGSMEDMLNEGLNGIKAQAESMPAPEPEPMPAVDSVTVAN